MNLGTLRRLAELYAGAYAPSEGFIKKYHRPYVKIFATQMQLIPFTDDDKEVKLF